eukprot:s6124_g1.t1
MSSTVIFHLLPLPGGSGGQAAPTKHKIPDDNATVKKPDTQSGAGQGANKNKKNKRSKQGRTNLPAGLHGYRLQWTEQFIDHDGAKHSWIAGSADSCHARRMIHQGTLLEADLNVVPYFCRAPTASNIADGPSRMDFRLCWHIGATQTHVTDEFLRKCLEK